MYIKLVLCAGGLRPSRFLTQAPEFSNIAPDDEVMVEYANDEYRCRVINAIDVGVDSEEFKFIMNMVDEDVLPKVISRVAYYPMTYDDNTENADMVE